MPIRADQRRHYGTEWRTVTRPAALIRACFACERCDLPDRPAGLKSSLEGAHLDGDAANRADTNVAILCHKCHKAHDYAEWARKCRSTRIARKDANRPLFAGLSDEALR
jgi:hypothetical protein